MNPTHFKRSPDHEYAAIELDMTDFVEHLSEEYFSGNAEVKDDGVRTSPELMDCKTEDCTNLRESSSISEECFEGKEKVKNSFMFFYEIFQ